VKRKIPIILAIIIFISLLMMSCSTAQIPQVGDKAPDFTLESIDGKSVSMSDFRGKIVLVVFTSVKCADCEIQRPFIERAYEESGESLAVIDIYMFAAANTVRDYITEKRYTTFPSLPDLKGAVGSKYGVTVRDIPTSFFIDPEGVIKFRRIGRFQDQEEIESILKSL
jgi:peroxiredoxin